MSSKFSLLPIVRDQFATLVDSRTGKARLEDYFVLVALPLLLGLISWQAGWRLASVGELIAAVTLLTSFLFALAVYIFQLRIQLGRELNRVATSRTVRLIDEMFSNACYAIVVGLVLTGAIVICSLTRETHGAGALPVGVGGTALLTVLSTHFVGILAMSLKRLNAAYTRLNN